MVHVMAQQRDKLATFMPKPFSQPDRQRLPLPHLAVGPVGRARTCSTTRPTRGASACRSSPTSSSAACSTMPSAASAIVAPTVNSYKRIGVGAPTSGATWSPAYAAWGGNNRTQMIRVPGGPRFEHRVGRRLGQPVPGGRRDPRRRASTASSASSIPASGNTANLYTTPGSRRSTKRASSRFRPTCSRRASTCARDEVLRDWFGAHGHRALLDYIVQTKVDEFNAYHARRLAVGGRPLPDGVLGDAGRPARSRPGVPS